MRYGLLVTGLLLLAYPTVVAADSIYLKNGRVIRTQRSEVVGDKLVFLQYGAEITIPMSLVDRVEPDDELEEVPSPVRQPSPQDGDSDEDTGGTDEGEQDEVPAEETRGYWRARVEEIASQRADLQAQIVEHRREERAFLFSHRSTAETRRKIEAAQ